VTTETGTTAPSDSDIENRIKSKLNDDPELRVANLDVDASISDNEVKLSGTVATEGQRTRAVNLAKDAHPGILVTDKIDVKPRELSRAEYSDEHAVEERSRARQYGDKIGDSLDDAWIHSKIVTKLIADPTTPERRINVDVDQGVVTLRGTVDSAAARSEAERIARETEGVKRVGNMLKVGVHSKS
jgi:hyperosmotically inducible protein